MMSQRKRFSSCVSSWTLPNGLSVLTFHVLMVGPFVTNLIDGLAPVANLSHPPWGLAVDCEVVVIPGPTDPTLYSFFVPFYFLLLGLKQYLRLPSPLQEFATGRTKRASQSPHFVFPPTEAGTMVWLGKMSRTKSELSVR
ncbi:hypothetical protein DPMN_135015 [Dreissena polymorpha]|uniref:Uncharacterized protein n=1 Tax=Dreissena polymorpha TaxID=45954 RepID=A0A9D4JB82_DREPO|nr:hypothetical protein DPMN_135015 [Dreissena polymorpha]